MLYVLQLVRRAGMWKMTLRNAHLRFQKPHVYEVAIPSLKVVMDSSAFDV